MEAVFDTRLVHASALQAQVPFHHVHFGAIHLIIIVPIKKRFALTLVLVLYPGANFGVTGYQPNQICAVGFFTASRYSMKLLADLPSQRHDPLLDHRPIQQSRDFIDVVTRLERRRVEATCPKNTQLELDVSEYCLDSGATYLPK